MVALLGRRCSNSNNDSHNNDTHNNTNSNSNNRTKGRMELAATRRRAKLMMLRASGREKGKVVLQQHLVVHYTTKTAAIVTNRIRKVNCCCPLVEKVMVMLDDTRPKETKQGRNR